MRDSKRKLKLQSHGVSNEKQAAIIFVGVGFEKALIALVASGVLIRDGVITQSRERIYVSPVRFQSPGSGPGVGGAS